jgi:Glyoxalase-like domain
VKTKRRLARHCAVTRPTIQREPGRCPPARSSSSKAARSSIVIDVWVPHDQAGARVAAALAAGGRLVSDQHAPEWWTLADAEGNEVDVATWQGRA